MWFFCYLSDTLFKNKNKINIKHLRLTDLSHLCIIVTYLIGNVIQEKLLALIWNCYCFFGKIPLKRQEKTRDTEKSKDWILNEWKFPHINFLVLEFVVFHWVSWLIEPVIQPLILNTQQYLAQTLMLLNCHITFNDLFFYV